MSNVRGQPPTDTYKVTATYFDGFKNTAFLVIAGFDADRKARRTAETIFARTSRMLERMRLPGFSETHIELLGAEHMCAWQGGRVVETHIELLGAEHMCAWQGSRVAG